MPSSVLVVVRLSQSDGFPGLGGLITIVNTVMIVVTKIIIRDRPDIMGRLGLSQLDVTHPGTIRVSGHARLHRDVPAPSLDIVLTRRTSGVSPSLIQGDGIPTLPTVFQGNGILARSTVFQGDGIPALSAVSQSYHYWPQVPALSAPFQTA